MIPFRARNGSPLKILLPLLVSTRTSFNKTSFFKKPDGIAFLRKDIFNILTRRGNLSRAKGKLSVKYIDMTDNFKD